MRTLRTLGAFLKRDFLIEISYRTSFVMQLFGIVFSVLIWYFIAGIVNAPKTTPGLNGVDYFPYVLLGMAIYSFLSAAVNSLASKIRNEQTTGTLEAMLVTPTAAGTVVLGSSLWDFVLSSFRVFLYLLIGAQFFKVTLYFDHLPAALVILALTILAFSGIGIMSAAFVIYLKRGDPITYVITSASALMGNVFYPSEDMWPILRTLSRLLPITYTLSGLRKALLQEHATLQDILPDIQILALFVAVLLPLGVLAFRVAVRKARQEGSLVQY